MLFLGATAYPQPTTGDRIQSDRIFTDRKVNDAFQGGEWFRLRMRYGFLNASYATVKLRETSFRDQAVYHVCLLYTSPSPRDGLLSRMPSSA